MGKFIKFSKIFVIVVFLLTLVIQQPGEAVTISNGEFVIRSLPGQQASSTFSIGNNEDEALVVDIMPVDWQRDKFGNLVFLGPNDHERSIANWIEHDPKQFVLSPDANQEINFSVLTPSDATGSYWGGFLAEVRSESDLEQEADGVGVAIATRFLIKIFVDTAAGINAQGSLLSIQNRGFNPYAIDVDFLNTGNTRLENIRGRVEVRNLTGDTVKSIPINDFTVLPGDGRIIRVIDEVNVEENLQPGRYIALAILDLGLSNLLGGQLIFEVPELNLAPIGELINLPQDLDNDGFYEDINGDGQLDQSDVEIFEQNVSSSAVQMNWRAFDFDNSGVVDERDADSLLDLIV